MKLAYKAVTRDGKAVHGIIEAKDDKDAAGLLRSRDLLPTEIAPDGEGLLTKYLPFLNKAKFSDLIFFTRQLSSMLVSGLTLMQALTIIKDQMTNKAMADVVSTILVDVEGGSSFSEALAKYPTVFPFLYVSLIRAGEKSGLIDKVLLRLAENLEKQEQLRMTIKSALLYPVIVVIGIIVVISIMMIFVIPQLTGLYESLNISLPLPTLIIIGLSKFMVNYWFLMLGFVVIGYLAFRRWHATVSGQLVMDDLILRLPVFGNIINESILAEISRTLGLLIGSGTLVVDALHETADVADNILYHNAIMGVASRVEKGLSMGDSFGGYTIFPNTLVQMVKVGEQTGKVDESLLRISDYYEREVELKVKNITTAMEPIIIIILGVGVAFLIFSIITPIYSLISQIQ